MSKHEGRFVSIPCARRWNQSEEEAKCRFLISCPAAVDAFLMMVYIKRRI